MKRRTLWIGGMSLLLGLCVVLANMRSSSAEAFKMDPQTARRLAVTSEIARAAYKKLKYARESFPGTVTDKDVSNASLQWFKCEVERSVSKEGGVKAATEYLQREGVIVREAEK